MAYKIVDLRGAIGDLRPETTLSARWVDKMPRADRFGIHSVLVYNFAYQPGKTIGVASGDRAEGIIGVPASEIWEVFQYVHKASFSIATACSAVRVTLAQPPAAQWIGAVGVPEKWVETYFLGRDGRTRDFAITRERAFTPTDKWEVIDEASETDLEGHLRRRILYAGSTIKAAFDIGTNATINSWLLAVDCVRYPSNERLLDMMDKGEITERQLFAALALRVPSPPEAF